MPCKSASVKSHQSTTHRSSIVSVNMETFGDDDAVIMAIGSKTNK